MNNEQTENIINRQSPKNIDAEQMLIGALLINSRLLEQVGDFLKAEHFYEKLHQNIFSAIEILTEKNIISTPITLRSILEKDSIYQESNGNEYLIHLTTKAIVVINPKDYGKIIYDLAIKRSLINIGENIVNIAYESTLEQTADEQLELAESKIYNLASKGVEDKGFISVNKSMPLLIENINNAMKNKSGSSGISTGLIDLNKKISGFKDSDLIILAGRPGMGKTAFALNFALNACKDLMQKAKKKEDLKSVGIFSLEMSNLQLQNRLVSMVSGINSLNLGSGNLTEEEYNNVRKSADNIMNMPLFIDDTPALTISALRTRARKLKRQHNLGIIIIDYLQLMHASSNNKSGNRVQEVSEITQGLKNIAKELNIPVIALAQLSRAVEQRIDKRPVLSDLRESGSIEQDADIVMFLYREEYYVNQQKPINQGQKYNEWLEKSMNIENIAEIIIAKHRNGPVGNIKVRYIDKLSQVKNSIN